MKHYCRYPFCLLLLSFSLVAASSVPADSPPVFLLQWGTIGEAEGQFFKPRMVAVDALGHVYLADTNRNRVQKFDGNGTFLRMWGWGVQDGSNSFQTCTDGCGTGFSGDGDGQFDVPWGIAVDATGNFYVVSIGNHRVQKFDRDGTFLRMWGWGVQDGSSAFQVCTSSCRAGISGGGDGQFSSPSGVAVASTGDVYVAGPSNHRIQRFSSMGTYLDKWGTFGLGDGELVFPADVAIDASDNVYVSDTNAERIQKFDRNGTFLAKWGTHGSGDGQFNLPNGVAVDGAGDVYVADGGNNRIQKFDPRGVFLTKWGTTGSGEGQFSLPYGLAVAASGYVYVADIDNHRIQKFGGPWLNLFIGDLPEEQ